MWPRRPSVKIIAWKGACEVHERFTGDELRAYREADPSVQIIAHPECPPDVLAEADFTGSTAHMINWVRNKHPKRVVMITECSMADNVQAELPDVEMVRPCNLCPHMKRITLPKILDSLVYLREEVTIDPLIAEKARRSVERMINLKKLSSRRTPGTITTVVPLRNAGTTTETRRMVRCRRRTRKHDLKPRS